MKEINTKCEVDVSEVEEAIKRLERLTEILEEANLLISKLTPEELALKVRLVHYDHRNWP